MSSEPSIEDHVAFRKLLGQNNPVAVEVHAAFSTTRDHAAFNAGVIRAVRGLSVEANAPKVKAGLPKTTNAQTKTPNSTAKPVPVCRHLQSTGNCKSGSSCKFSHDIAAKEVAATDPKLGRVPLSKTDKAKPSTQKSVTPNTPPRSPNRQVAGTPVKKTADDAEIEENAPASPADRAAAKSRFLGLFGVRSSATHPATEEAPLMPTNALPTTLAHTAPTSAETDTKPAIAAPATVDSTSALESPPRREHVREKGLEELLFDSPPSSKQFWNEVNSATNTSTNPHSDLELDLSLDFGKLNFDSVPLGAPLDSALDSLSALSEPLKMSSAPPAPPGFGNAPFPFPIRPENGFPYPYSHGGPPGGPPGQYGHPFGGLMPPPGGLFPPPQGMPGMPGMFPPPPPLPLPNGNMSMNGVSMPPMGPYGGFPGGFPYGPPPGHLMPPPPHLQQQQQQFGQHGQMYQTTTCAPVRSTLSDFPAPPASTSHLSVHDMLGQSTTSGSAPLSPGADERSQQLLRLLNGGGAPLPSASAASAEPGSSTDTTSPFSKSLQVPVSSAVGGPQQKSRALLSLLKSSKAGPTLALNGAPPTPTSVGSNSTASFAAPGSPMSQSRPPMGLAGAPTSVPAPQFTTPVKGKNRSQSITSDVGDDGEPVGAATPGVAATPARKASFFRNTKFQCGHMQIAVNGVVRSQHIMAPSTNMAVHWQMPQEEFHTLMNKPNTALVIGLVRYGSYTNSPCFVSKQIERRPKQARDSEGHPIYAGTVVFHAPKSAGQFVYRLFDESTKDSALTTLATSPMFSVDLADFYVNTNLRHILEALGEKSKVKGISQMPAVIRGIRNGGRNDRASGSSDQMITECFQIVLRAVEDAIPAIETWKDRKRAITAEEKETGKESALATGKEAEEGKAAYKQAMRVQGEAFAAISSLLESRAPFLLLSPAMRDIVARQQSLFCPHLNRYFRDAQHMQAYRIEEIGFNVALDQPLRSLAQAANVSYGEVMSRVDASIEALLPKLMPRADFQYARETAVAQLQLALITENAVPPGTEVALYGSSNNTFGSDGADMDMTLLFPPGIRLTAEDKPVVIERLGAVLTRIGMSSVTTRATARIPIVQFKDPLHAFDCDISLQNQLAVANTKLLRTYGSIDPRVRKLVFLLKHWAKSRHLNSPSDGTLSSYGFILCLIHFLQNRPVPLVPNLQTLPPVWNGARRPSAPLPVHLDPLSQQGGNGGHNNKQQEHADSLSQFERQSLPKVHVPSADNIRCNTYFYTPTLAQPQLLPDFARENQETVAELLIEFFRFFAWHFDFRHQVVSVRQSSVLSKLDKAEQHGWLQSDVLSIEDPFETHYDVAHVIKSAQMVYFRKELLRAYTLASRVFTPSSILDSLPASVAPEDFMALLCEPAELPPFAGARDRLVSVDIPTA